MKLFSLEKITPAEARRLRLLIFATAAFGALTALFPYQNLVRHYLSHTGFFTHETSACFFLNIFNIPCPFCGVSRAMLKLISFDIAGSIFYNPTAFIVYPAAVLITGGIFLLSFKNYRVKINYAKRFWLTAAALFCFIWALNIIYGHQ